LILNGLLDIPANFHVITEWHPVDNAKARKEIASRRRHHHNSKTSFVSNLQDRQNTGNQDNLVDDSKAAAVAELGNALTAIGMEGKNFGEFHAFRRGLRRGPQESGACRRRIPEAVHAA
jgi:hypothetical protein